MYRGKHCGFLGGVGRVLAPVFISGVFALLVSSGAAAQGESTSASGQQYGGEPGGAEPAPPEVAAPVVGAGSWVVTDARSGEILAGEDESRAVPMASTTKIMTALVVLENAELDEEVRVSELAASFAIPAYSNAGLQQGDVLSVRELLDGAMIVSGNDAAVALAEYVGGGGGQRGVDEFVGMMNDEAERLGLRETSFANPTGLDDEAHRSSARDLAELARVAGESDVFREMVGAEYAVATTKAGREIPLTNINELLYLYPAATGVKTGTSPGAGPSLVGSASADGEDYIAVILDGEDRYGGMVQILDYGFAAYDLQSLVRREETYEEVQLPYRRDENLSLVAGRDVEALIDAESSVERRVSVEEELPPSAEPGERLGEIVLFVDGERVGESPLLAASGYEEAPVWQRFGYTVSRLWN